MRTAAMVLLVSLVFMCGVAWQLASDRQVLLQKTVEVTATTLVFASKGCPTPRHCGQFCAGHFLHIRC